MIENTFCRRVVLQAVAVFLLKIDDLRGGGLKSRMGSFGETRLTETYIGVEYVGDLRMTCFRGNRFALV